ncbi:glycosyltransferase family 2 protein [Bacillus wiedmannii]|uniref:glycosyltransferase family 2 protein n=1 Tax=Bacillus wiedmannii TaxID=1890302 RepID=UPI000BFBDA9C|nr:glycosyltransferase family A protein [Bacillus wiedmannii]PHG78415.1 hypothetical protein COI50_10030 [Bacillus wiedmannii]
MQKVSVVIPVYNVEKYIMQCLNSVLDQSYSNLEVIIVDDCSTDTTISKIKGICDERIKLLINSENKGPSFSRNRAIECATGDYIALLDGDDWWDSKRIERLMVEAKNRNADLISDDQLLIEDGHSVPYDTVFNKCELHVNEPMLLDAAIFVNNNLGLKPIIKKEFLIHHGIKFNEELTYGEDYTLFLDILLKEGNYWVLKDAYYYYRSRKGSLVTHRLKMLEQVLETTEFLMNSHECQQNKEVRIALEKRKKYIQESIKYYQVIQPLKNKDFMKSLFNLKANPSALFIILKRVPKFLKIKYKKITKS